MRGLWCGEGGPSLPHPPGPTHHRVRRSTAVGRLGLRRAGPLALRPAGEVALRPARDRQRARRDVAAYDGPATGRGAVADLDRRDEGVVGAGAGVTADAGAVLGDPVVVGEDRARPDVGLLADLRVADVGQVRHLGALADLGVLGLHEGADLALRAQHGAGAQVGERSDAWPGRR